jgi:hypothetical protein
MRPRVFVLSVLGFTLIAVACGDAPEPARFTGPSPVVNVPPPSLIEVRFTGQVTEFDREGSVDGATVTLFGGVGVAQPVTVMTGAGGAFELTVTLAEGWRSVGVAVARDGYEPASKMLGPQNVTGTTISLYPMLTVRPGESIETGLAPGAAPFVNGYYCWFLIDEASCRRVVVDAPPGQAVEIELTPHGSLDRVGLIDAVQQPAFTAFQRRLTVTKGEVWIVGNAGPVTLRASLR